VEPTELTKGSSVLSIVGSGGFVGSLGPLEDEDGVQ
jgi:hypothetical protein